MGKRFLLGTLGAPAGVLGSGVDGPRRNQLLIAQIMKILEKVKRFSILGIEVKDKCGKTNKKENKKRGKHLGGRIGLIFKRVCT